MPLFKAAMLSLSFLSLSVVFSVQLWMVSSFHFSSLCFLAFSFLLPLLKLPESPSPSVSPLNDQTALVRHHSALSWRILVVPQQKVFLAGLDLRTLAGHILCPDPEELVSSANSAFTLFVNRDDVDGELPPLSCFICFQDVDLNGIIFLAVLLHIDLQLAFGCLAVGFTVWWLFCAACSGGWRSDGNFYAGGNGWSALLVAVSTTVACDTRHTVFTGALACGLVTGFARGPHRMAITGFAGLSVGDGLGHVSIVALFAVVAVATSCIVAAVQTDSSTFPSREFVKLHVETTAPRMKVTIAGDTFVGFSGGCALPGSVIVKRFASVTLWSGCVVLALAH